jgi:hypothetical protein
VPVEKECEPEAEDELQHARHHGIEERVEQRQPGRGVADQKAEILQADPLARSPDLGVGEAEPGPEPERVGEENEEQSARGQQEEQPEGVPVIEKLLQTSALLQTL